MNAQFQNLFDNVCRCFGHNPNNNTTGGGTANHGESNATNSGPLSNSTLVVSSPQHPVAQASSTSSAGARRRTNRLELKDKQWDELFEKNQRGLTTSGSGGQKHPSSRSHPPRPEGYRLADTRNSSTTDHETAQALAQAKLAANPPRYRTKRKRSAQSREEIFRNKEERSAGRSGGTRGNGVNNQSSRSNATSTPQTDFSRLLNPSLALCFATPVRGTEEEPEEQDLKSVDNSDTATLNTNGEDTITSTLYFDSKYAHIQETRPPMPLFNQFKIGQSKDEIRTIMATDSHSSLRMIKLMQQQQQQQSRDKIMEQHGPEGDDSSSSEDEDDLEKSGSRRIGGRSKGASSKKKDVSGGVLDHDEEMQDAVPDVKAVSSSTDSSRLSNGAKQHIV